MPNQQFYPKATFNISGNNFENAYNPSPRNYVTTFNPSAYDAVLKTVTTATLNFATLGIKVGDVCMVGLAGANVGNRSIIVDVKPATLTLTSNINASAGKPVIIYQNIPDPGIVFMSGPIDKNDVLVLGVCNNENSGATISSEKGIVKAYPYGIVGSNYDTKPIVPVQVEVVYSLGNGSVLPPGNGAQIYVTYN
tara:strand:+ start:1653 stop:2234 length:582 start_codon:yes stop_codon:yes gene_type:complete